MEETGYKLSRQDAAKILKISVRTLDRYIKDNKLSIVEIEGRVFLKMEEVKNFSKKKSKKYTNLSTLENSENVYRQNSDFVYTKTPNLGASESQNDKKVVYNKKTENVYRQNKKIVYSGDNEVDEKSNLPKRIVTEEKNIFYENPELEDLKKQLKENIEFQQSKERTLLAQISEISHSQREYERSLRIEKIKKRFFLILLMGILAFQPIWIYFTFFK